MTSSWCWTRSPIPAPSEERAGFAEYGRLMARARSFAGCQRATNDALTGALWQLDELLAACVVLALTGAGVRRASAVVLACFGHAVTLLRIALVSCKGSSRYDEQTAHSCSKECGLRRHG